MQVVCMLLLSIVALSQVHSQYSEKSPCKTPDDISGTCEKLKSCSPALERLNNTTPENRVYLKSSLCFRDANNDVWVCCPRPETRFDPKLPFKPIPGTLPAAPVCGFSAEDRIYGGTATDLDEFPWLALIGYEKARGPEGYHCGGSIINERYVLTAAHCVAKIPNSWKLVHVKLGEYDTATNPDCTTDGFGDTHCNDKHKIIKVVEKIVHSGYLPNSKEQHNDIALLRLETPVKYTQFIKPVCLPIEKTIKSKNWNDIQLVVAGWGKTENSSTSSVKLKVNITADANSDCQRVYNKQRLTILNSQICAGGDKGKDSCNGDSGGPLMGRVSNARIPHTVLVGIVSFGPKNCGTKDIPGVYTR